MVHLDRYFIIRAEKFHGCYCGKCGQRLLQDSYNYKKHALSCGFAGQGDTVEPITEGKSYGYRLERENDRLLLSVCIPHLKRLNGFQDRFRGTEWTAILQAVYTNGSKEIRIAMNQTGLSLDTWLSLIRDGKAVRIQVETDAEVIHSVFPIVLDTYSLQMFSYIYSHRGYPCREILPTHLKKKLFTEIPTAFSSVPHTESPSLRFSGNMNGSTSPEAFPACASLHRLHGEHYFLRILIKDRPDRMTIFVFSRDYCACNRMPDLKKFFTCRLHWMEGSIRQIRFFGNQYPEFTLSQYLENSDQVLFPLLSASYHAGLEITAKAGLSNLAERYAQLTEYNLAPSTYRNIKDLFRLPVNVLRRIPKEMADDPTLERIREIYACKPDYILNFSKLTCGQIHFFLSANLTHNGNNYRLHRSSHLTDTQVNGILRYLETHDFSTLYRDYLEICLLLNDFRYGVSPADLPLAHDMIAGLYEDQKDFLLTQRFVQAVSAPEYLRLTSAWKEENQETNPLDDSIYLILAPHSPSDLILESQNMHNCVRIYCQSVSEKMTKIYFLRHRNKPEKSLGTIEVSPKNELIQAKGFANHCLTEEEQKFVVKWCIFKSITPSSRDITMLPFR